MILQIFYVFTNLSTVGVDTLRPGFIGMGIYHAPPTFLADLLAVALDGYSREACRLNDICIFQAEPLS